jgi:hypothetical protein
MFPETDLRESITSLLVKPHLASHYVILACPESFFFRKIPDPESFREE